MWNPFRRRLRGWVSISSYYKIYERERKRNPSRFEKEEEQSRQWALRVFEKRRVRETGATTIKRKGPARESALGQLEAQARKAFMTNSAASEADFRQCWPSLRHELLKKHALEELAADPKGIDDMLKQFSGERRTDLFLVRDTSKQ